MWIYGLQFYTEKLGFIKKKDMPLDGGHRWITLVSKEAQDGPEILLEPAPNHFEPCKVFQDALMDAGIPWTQFDVDNVDEEYERLLNLGVSFSVKPKKQIQQQNKILTKSAAYTHDTRHAHTHARTQCTFDGNVMVAYVTLKTSFYVKHY